MSENNRDGKPGDGRGPTEQPQYGQYAAPGEQPQYGQYAAPGEQPQYGQYAAPGQQPQYGQYGPQDGPGVWQAPTYPPQGNIPPWQSHYGQAPGMAPRVPSVWARLGARLLDGLIVGIPLGIIGVITGWSNATAADGTLHYTSTTWLWNLFTSIVTICYCAYFYTAKGATPGKMACKLQVVNVENGQRISFGQGVIREIVLSLTGALCLLGYFSIFFDGTGRRRGWHDKAARSWVIGA